MMNFNDEAQHVANVVSQCILIGEMMASEIQMQSSAQLSAGVSALTLDTALAAVSSANADAPSEGCALNGIWMHLDFRCHHFPNEYSHTWQSNPVA